MAEIAVNLLTEYLGNLLLEQAELLIGITDEVSKIRDELESMRFFLRDADARQDGDERLKTWVRQIREVAYDIEDILDEFMLSLIEQQQHTHGFAGFLLRGMRPFKRLKACYHISTKIHNIKTRLSAILGRKEAYTLKRTEPGSISNDSNDQWYDPRLNSLFIEESELVGIDKPRSQLIEWLIEGEFHLSLISVIGMGGIGKTTLVKKVYDSQEVKKRFETYAWCTVSQKFREGDLLRSMILQFFAVKKEEPPQGMITMTTIQLIQILREYLQTKRYVVVLDDVWSANVWNFVRNALPASNLGCRVMLTSRREDVASSCCLSSSDQIYNLQPLSAEEAWSLFCKKAFQSKEDGSCPKELNMLSRSIVGRCGGLPLAIVTLGGLLLNKTSVEWEMIHRSLRTEFESDENMKSMMKILLLSFDDLPYHLKTCFLYLSIFPEDYNIKRTKLLRLWIAEGFVERKEGRTSEEVAEGYLNALISRNLIQVAERKPWGTVVACRVHDLLHGIIISRSKEQNFVSSSVQQSSLLPEKIRRLSLYDWGEIFPKFERCPSLRLLFFFGVCGLSNSFMKTSFADSRLLRLVDLENASIETFPDELTDLFHLRYLSLQNTKIKLLPKSVGRLTNLETLNLKGTLVSELPVEILKLHRLWHLAAYRRRQRGGLYFPFVTVGGSKVHYDSGEGYLEDYNCVRGTKVPLGIGSLRSLRILNLVEANAKSGVVKELGNLTQLTRLGVLNLNTEDGKDLCTSIEKMRHLRVLGVVSKDEVEVLDLHSLSYPPPLLQRVYFKGRLEKLPCWIASVQNLVCMHLTWSRLREDPLKFFQSFPNLVVLQLLNAYDGEELCCEARGFPRLQKLYLSGLNEMKNLWVEKGAMSNLQMLSINKCKKLVDVPSCLQSLSNLKELYLIDLSEAFTQQLTKDCRKVQHIPLIQCYNTQSRTCYDMSR